MDEDDGRLPASAGVGRVALAVNDLDRQVEFYRDVLGLSIRRRDEPTAVLGTDDVALLVLAERPDLPARAADETGLFHAAIRLPSRRALGDALVRVEDRWRLTGASDHLVSEALYLDDPEGNGLELYRDRPRADWPGDEGGRVAMETRRLDLDGLRDRSRGRRQVPPETDVGHVHLEVADVGATRRFYTDGLGLRVRQTSGEEAVFLAAGGYHHHVGANVWNRRTEPGDGRGLEWFEVRVPDEAAVDGARRRFEDRGRETSALEGGFAIEDPDGIELRVRVRSV